MIISGPSIRIPPSVANPVTPASIGPGALALWVRADLGITLNGSTVSAWADQSGNGRNLLQATGARQPLFVASAQNGNPGVRFDGVDDFMQAAFALNQPTTLCMVYKSIVLGGSAVHDGVADGGTVATMAVVSDSSPNFQITAGTALAFGAAVANGSYDRVVLTYNGASGNIRTAGVSRATGNVGAGNAGGFTLGALANNTRWTNIEVGEAFIYNRVLTAGEIASAEAYMQSFWGLP